MDIALEDIAYHLSSTKTKPNKIMREEILPFFTKQQISKVLDYGCGKYLRDALFLTREGFVVDAVDTEEQVLRIDESLANELSALASDIPSDKYDAALLNFVIQVLPTHEQRMDVLEKVSASLKTGGYLVLSLRNQNDINTYVKPKGQPFNDGYIMGRKDRFTFVRAYDKSEIRCILTSLDMRIVKMFRTPSSHICLGQK